MSDTYWLRCDNCRRSADIPAETPMEMAVTFKPSLFPWPIPKVHPKEVRHRCRHCGFVTVLVPQENSALTGSWRDSIVVK